MANRVHQSKAVGRHAPLSIKKRKDAHRSSIVQYLPPPLAGEALNKLYLLITNVIVACLPFAFFEVSEVKELLSYLRSNVILPSRDTIRNAILPQGS
ncbi:Uncharacterized protein PBTT_09399 [Plasmodiophora brassicae]